jgi:hypothetical protein
VSVDDLGGGTSHVMESPPHAGSDEKESEGDGDDEHDDFGLE